MSLRSGTVTRVADGEAWVCLDPEATDAPIEGCKGCGGRCGLRGRQEARVAAQPGMRPGDRVEVEVFFPNPAFSACLLFLGPLVLVLGGMIAWPAAVRAGSQGMGLVVGLAAAALWYAGVAAYDRRLRRDPARRPRLVSWSRSSDAAAPPGGERP